jgi:ribosomal protection tetracycline resistance protein
VKKTSSWVQGRQPDEGIFDRATVGLRIEPAAPGSGVSYGLEVELGALPLSFHTTIEESVRKRLLAGPPGTSAPSRHSACQPAWPLDILLFRYI